MTVAEVETASRLDSGAQRIPRPMSTRERRRRFVRTTPGRWQAMTAVLLVALVGYAVVALTVVGSRQHLVQQLTTQTATALDDSAKLYASLSDADETASRAALSPSGEPIALRRQYEQDLHEVARLLARLSAGGTDLASGHEALATVGDELPDYSGLVETARADNRQGSTLSGTAYQRAASTRMRTTLLPAVRDLYLSEADELMVGLRTGSSMLGVVAVVAAGLLLLYLLVLLQRNVGRVTNRRVNPGLLGATVVVLLGAVAVSLLLVRQQDSLDDARTSGGGPLVLLSTSRILALQSQADENLALQARGGGDRYNQDFDAIRAALIGDAVIPGGLLSAASPGSDRSASSSLGSVPELFEQYEWMHAIVLSAETQGDYTRATQRALDREVPAFENLNTALVRRIAAARDLTGRRLDDAAAALRWAPVVVALSAVVSVGLVLVGMRRRIGEYR